jgi:hypothetical protein
MAAQWKGLDQIDAMVAKLQGLPQWLGQTVVDRVKQKTPVRTGALRDAWTYEVDESLLTVGNTIPYAIFVELGTPKMAPQGMLSTTILEVPQLVITYLEG